MSNFNALKTAVQKQMATMVKEDLFLVDIDKDYLWNTYINSFPEGTNPTFRERTEHDCQCCKQFIRACGNVVSIVKNKLVSIWDVKVEGGEEDYQVVVDALSKAVKSKAVKDIFLSGENKLGTNFNHQLLENGKTTKWEHFYFELPNKFVCHSDSIGTKLSEKRSNKEVFKRGLTEISIESIETVLELIDQNSLYRGEEKKAIVESFLKCKKEFDNLKGKVAKDNFCWTKSLSIGSASRIKNDVIGTLLIDISKGEDLDKAVRLFESKVAPTNYQRPSAVISKKMIENAQKKVEELGISDALDRRYATVSDITINNVLFADRDSKVSMNVFDELTKDIPDNIPKMGKVEEVDVETFINSIVPKAKNIELFLENKNINNMMSLIAPQDKNSRNIFKWDNNFSWSYNGEVTDSIKERVKKAGGNVNGVLRCSLSWFNYDDLDIHVVEPKGNHIFYNNARIVHNTSGCLDIDMNAGGTSRNAVENIVWTNKNDMLEGDYRVFINNFSKRETVDVGFDVEMEYEGQTHIFHYNKPLRSKENVEVVTFSFTRKDGIKIIESLPSTQTSKDIWGIKTNKYHKVKMIMNSPNHWDGKKTGNKHYFFILEDCKNEEKSRGFYNEFLKEDLRPHRKVFEVLGSKMKTEKSNDQLSGLGFSSTQNNSILCKVTGSFNRTIKINF